MFNQVKLSKEQWNLQTIWWRENESEPLKEYWLTVVSFGLTSSAYLAVRCVIQAAREAQEIYPEAAKAIENDYYMDDCVTGTHMEQKAIELAKNMDQILKGAGFELRKWKSNNKTVSKAMDSVMEKSMIFSEEDSSTILGLKWLIEKDQFTFIVKSPKIEGKLTKRKIASCVAQLYDPNGYISPVIMIGRKIVQDLWKEKFEWDQEVSKDIQKRWEQFWTDIIQLEKFKINRWIGTSDDCDIQIHGFADASVIGYGTSIYVRVEHLNGKITSSLLISKMRVAPLKTVTIPRLELTAAEMLSRLYEQVKTSIEWNRIPYSLWSDSTITLHWIRKEPHSLKVFAANRVASIQERTNIECWHHVDSSDNPADLVSRGLLPSDLVDNKLWLHGPEWLTKPRSSWPSERFIHKEPPGAEMLAEVK
ncbi:uncharacterized protein LOC129579531, partial [Sitodiplosis mosellana]|uniref:uncharacterized protein LOC129579531 n=1 Tax=Sitodiplosis mosellana TaxID=263140 RepID=UPI00244479EF